jgi:hypothetical protein
MIKQIPDREQHEDGIVWLVINSQFTQAPQNKCEKLVEGKHRMIRRK